MNWWSTIRNNVSAKNCYNNDKYEEEQQQEEILAQFYLPYAKLECESFDSQNDWLSAGIASVQGWRINQEDAHLCDLNFDTVNHTALFGVFDGHNGPEVSRYAAQKLPQLIKNNRYYQKKEYGKALEEAFLEFDGCLLENKTNKELQRISCHYESSHGRIRRRQNSPLLGMVTGSTAVVALLCKHSGQVYVANIGDSRCVIFLKNKYHPMTTDHKPTDDKEMKRIVMAGSRVVNGRINSGLNLSRAFGDFMLKDNEQFGAEEQAVIALPDLTVSNDKIRACDFMILACDGIWNCMNEKDVCMIVRKHMKKNLKPSKICQEVIRKCVSPVRPIDGQIGGDNMTCIVVKFERDLPC